MALVRKRPRLITVNGVAYRWRVLAARRYGQRVPEGPGRQLAYDEAGRLYEAGVRNRLAAVLDPGQLAMAETLFAIGHAAAGMRQVTRQLGSLLGGMGDDPARVISRLYERQDTGARSARAAAYPAIMIGGDET